ncbi:WYL domain-containing protein (plasmid) [Bartonella sp. HY329]|uniref:helix-turn-helix transcriptional regulator n=1 Tax=unclassified Bartonella TaxID=2645622 RepID=UPI0021C7C5B3|nr:MULTISPECIES: WYL domain-containing protein [unclassified Bartonella]UXM96563.1 WYL domain-containing protein [Bartonella sp. HY329]UXN10886.1 WYL domain-containing protein [Bartonella sp. HY328]
MAYKKAGELLNLAIDIASRRYGMTYSEIDDYSKTSNIESRLRDLYNKLMATAGQNLKKSTLIDYDYLIESNYIAATTGPHVEIDRKVVQDIYEALTAGNQIEFEYFDSYKEAWISRHVHPQGLIIGRRHYLIAISDKALQFQSPVWYRLDRMRTITQLPTSSQKLDNFNLADYAKRAFGGFYSDEEYNEVEWRFAKEAARAVKNYRFHLDQITCENDDGSVTIGFKAAGFYEMAWALYPWGNKIEVIKPQALRDLVDKYRRDDFPMLP